jgi:FMN phosphatase YigB (HAD superfamily)
MTRHRGLLVDWGGVMTTSVFDSFRAFFEVEGLSPETVGERFRCVFVDDLTFNLPPARALGMATIHHVDPAQTIAELEGLLSVKLR